MNPKQDALDEVGFRTAEALRAKPQPEIKTDAPIQRVVEGGQIFAVADVDNGLVLVKLLFDGREIVVPLEPSESVKFQIQIHRSAAYVRKHKGAKKPK